ncbi:hypothetical protein [Nitrospirillum iridis]|uniref:Uncharacterized protein n=1 Tax=Nitrospirillum iridis TaxID=765888 RepID=A0A7X0B2E5_9PROT|nr:hypothetical protein [Nitrospirillum iridis]MBB6253161.1 hypothetical protein [Nitrospirillum iridis]
MIATTTSSATASPVEPPPAEYPAMALQGHYHDALTTPDGRVLWDRGWKRNTIVSDCRRLLAGFLHGGGISLAIQGLWVGRGSDGWDVSGPPPGAPTQSALVDPFPFLVPPAAMQIDFLDGAAVTATPTNRLQIKATLGPGLPPWPDGNHATANLREFGLVGQIGGVKSLINYVTHPVIVKDPVSTLTRTIWLVF